MALLDWLKGERTAPGRAADALYDSLVARARRTEWYLAGGVPDTLDGRFSVLSNVVALAVLRLEQFGEDGIRHSVSLVERFVADMDVQMREEGFSDTSLGKQVRHLVGALSSRTERWRDTIDRGEPFAPVAVRNLYGSEEPDGASGAGLLEREWGGLSRASLGDLVEGRL